MSNIVEITSADQLSSLLSSSRIVIANFYSAATQSMSPLYEQIALSSSVPNKVTCVKVDTEQQPQIAQSHNVTTSDLPAFIVFLQGKVEDRVNRANNQKLSEAVQKANAVTKANATTKANAVNKGNAAKSGGSSSSGSGGANASADGTWRGADLPRGYGDITEQVDVRGLDLLNSDTEFGGVRTLFEKTQPSALAAGKGKRAASGSTSTEDWVESDVDEQLMLYLPFTSTIKAHTIHITSCLPSPDEDDDEDAPMRPKTIRLYTNRQHNLGFEEAEDIPPTQVIELKPSDWDEKTSTAKVELRFVKFQNISSMVLFVVDGDGDGEKTRIDRLRIIGDAGEKRDMGKLEKIGDDP
ncbi:PITH domain-containing protein [Massariosphaeria phaeospora]|uniref:PITH domain-containing protein n=1 Tax=Massariosphaeria phaeospora TaxID=100035 RepID=A0A7C8MFB6_9PLEO|nr:PITH domain-containing protein [Massariosphaeria phaeospora]